MAAPAATPPVALPSPNVNQGGVALPFRRATIERNTILIQDSNVVTASTIPIDRTIEGTGFLYAIRLKLVCTTSANAATVAFAEDGPYSALGSVVLRDVNGEVVNCPSGWYMYLANLVDRNYSNRWIDQSTETVITSGSGGTGGSFTIFIDVPLGTNRRDLLGILGNQDRAQKYQLRTDMNPSASIYSTPPTNPGTLVINRYYQSYSVPMPVGPNGARQAVLPDNYGTVHFTTVTTNEATPLGGSTVNHYLRRLGNTIRWMALVFRSNGTRANVETNRPTQITFRAGDDTIFTEDYAYRRSLMYERFGFDMPPGVLVYDAIHDFSGDAGFEVGDDYYHTQSLTQAEFDVTYPAGYGSTNNSLTIVTDDLAYSQPA